MADRDDTSVSLSCCCDQMPDKINLRKGGIFGSQFEGSQSITAEAAVGTGDGNDWSLCFRSQEAEKRDVEPGSETQSFPPPPIVTHILQLDYTAYRIHSILN